MNTHAHEHFARGVVAALGGKWHGNQGLCRCPAHDDQSPSLSVRAGERSILVHCFAGCDGRVIMRELRNRGLLDSTGHQLPEQSPAGKARDNAAFARRLWSSAKPIAGTLAEIYLQTRGIGIPSPALRFMQSAQVGRREDAVRRPALIVSVTDNTGEVVAVQRTFLDRPGCKVAIDSPRRALGPVTEGLARLLPLNKEGRLGIAEGVETALSASQMHGIPCWATLGTEMFGMRPLPADVRELTLFLDSGAGGDRAEQLAARWAVPGRTVLTARPPHTFGDWNDVLMHELATAQEEEGRRKAAE